jgi:hypothetical protein
MAQEPTTAAPRPAPASGLLLNVERLPAAADRSKVNGSVADNDGSDK